MPYSWNKPVENLPEEMTAIWSCTKEGCNGWMRDNFSFKDVPVCSLCASPMKSSSKLLPILFTSETQIKQYRRKQQQRKVAAE